MKENLKKKNKLNKIKEKQIENDSAHFLIILVCYNH